MTRPRAALLLILALPLLSGCRLGYYARAAWGQGRIVFGSEDIEDLLADPELPAKTRERLELVPEIKRFAVDEVGLADNDNYTTYYDLKGTPITFTVVACPADSLAPVTWDFPIVGELPYIGFFDEAEAEAEAARLREEGNDVVVWPAAAYSTLGWFSDPVLSTMIDEAEVDFVDLLLHEQTHATVYVDEDIAFNETLAVFVAHAGTVAFYEARGQPERAQEARDLRHDRIIVSQETQRLVKDLNALYDSGLSRDAKLLEKRKVFARFRLNFRFRVMPRLRTRRFDSYARCETNNALVATRALYTEDLSLFEAVAARCGSLKATFAALREVAESERPGEALEAAARGQGP